jgi:hypothetical protein
MLRTHMFIILYITLYSCAYTGPGKYNTALTQNKRSSTTKQRKQQHHSALLQQHLTTSSKAASAGINSNTVITLGRADNVGPGSYDVRGSLVTKTHNVTFLNGRANMLRARLLMQQQQQQQQQQRSFSTKCSSAAVDNSSLTPLSIAAVVS